MGPLERFDRIRAEIKLTALADPVATKIEHH